MDELLTYVPTINAIADFGTLLQQKRLPCYLAHIHHESCYGGIVESTAHN